MYHPRCILDFQFDARHLAGTDYVVSRRKVISVLSTTACGRIQLEGEEIRSTAIEYWLHRMKGILEEVP